MLHCLFNTCGNEDLASAISKKIDRSLKKEKKHFKKQVKVLLLGSGESGKSTFLKQMNIIYGRGEFTAEELRKYRQIICLNVINAMRCLIREREKFYEQDFDTAILQQSAEEIQKFHADSSKYFFENIDRISREDYIPTNRDILLARKATRGIIENTFNIQKTPFRFVDVGGQKSQRQMWFQCFEGITSILFFVASNEYDQVCLEDKTKNRVAESRDVFDTIVNYKFFANVALILFLNKTDLLIEKVTKSDIKQHFPKFVGDSNSYIDVQQFLMNLFESARREPNRAYFYHYTTAVDTENIRIVFQNCKEVILEQNLRTLLMQ